MNPISSSSQAFEQLAQSFTKSAVGKTLNAETAVRLSRKVHGFADRQMTELVQHGVSLDCKPQCSFCCNQIVFATAPEIAQLFAEVATWDQMRVESFRVRAQRHADAMEPHRSENFVRARFPCPFLVNNLCEVYEQRPLSCRGLTSRFVQLCEDWHDHPNEAHDNFGPNGETELAYAGMRGIQEGLLALTADHAPLELSLVMLDLLKEPTRLDELLGNSDVFAQPRLQGWRLRFTPPRPDPLGAPVVPEDYKRFILSRRTSGLRERLKLVSKPSAANFFARVTVPAIYEDAAQMEEWYEHFLKSISDLQSASPWDPREAYYALSDLRPIAAGYLPYALTEPMSLLGTVLHDRIATKIAPELVEPPSTPRRPGKIRVAIASNIGNNSVSKWTLGWVEGLDRSQFEVTVLKISGAEDATSYRFKDKADHYYRLAGHPIEIARFIRTMDLDYLIYSDIGDLGVQYQLSIFRLARVQATAWGCPFTSGLSSIDYYLSSEIMEPENGEEHYTETLVKLPNSGLAFGPLRQGGLQLSRQDLGLPEGFLATFPQYVIKWLPTSDYLLKEIAERTSNPIVVFDVGNAYEKDLFETRMARQGIPLIWLQRMQPQVFQRVLQLCDVALDSPDWSGGLTSVEAITAGVPFVVMPGLFLRQRLAKAFVEQAYAPQLVVQSPDAYVELATSGERLADATKNLKASSLFNDRLALQGLERHIAGAVSL